MTSILIVEDNSLQALELEAWLVGFGYQVLQPIVKGTDEALEQINRLRPNLVLIDVHLENRFAGIELARQLLPRQVPFVLMTQDDSTATFDAARKFLPYGYLIKPIGKKRLRRSVELALTHAQERARRSPQPYFAKDRRGQLTRIDLNMLAFVEAIGNYCYLHVGGQRFSSRVSLVRFLAQMPEGQFLQIHRRFLVAVAKIDALNIAEDTVVVEGNALSIGGKYKKAVVKRIRNK